MQVRWVGQTQYPMIVVASLSAVPKSCRTPRKTTKHISLYKVIEGIEVPHLPRRPTHTPRSSGAFPEDASWSRMAVVAQGIKEGQTMPNPVGGLKEEDLNAIVLMRVIC